MGWRYLLVLVGMIPSRRIKSNHSIVLNRSLSRRLSQFDALLDKYTAKVNILRQANRLRSCPSPDPKVSAYQNHASRFFDPESLTGSLPYIKQQTWICGGTQTPPSNAIV